MQLQERARVFFSRPVLTMKKELLIVRSGLISKKRSIHNMLGVFSDRIIYSAECGGAREQGMEEGEASGRDNGCR
jgi:hypothetical protein